FVGGEANYSDQGANRLGASALMQGLADGYFILPATVPDYLARNPLEKVDTSHPAFREAEEEVRKRTQALLRADGRRTVGSLRRELGLLMWGHCGMARSDAGLRQALARIPALRAEFHDNVRVLGTGEELNQALEKAGRVADFLELAELMCLDALERRESCGGDLRGGELTAEGWERGGGGEWYPVGAWRVYGGGVRAYIDV